jgi:hypothetical protein
VPKEAGRCEDERENENAPLACGVIDGPLFVVVFLVEAATRAGYDPLRHPVSSLASVTMVGLTFPDATPYAEVPAGTYTLDVNPVGTDDTVLTVPGVALTDGAVYSAFAVGTVFADSLDVLLVQDNGGGGAASASKHKH